MAGLVVLGIPLTFAVARLRRSWVRDRMRCLLPLTIIGLVVLAGRTLGLVRELWFSAYGPYRSPR